MSHTMDAQSGWNEAKHGEFNLSRILRHYLNDDDLYDLDEDLGQKISEGGGSTVVIPTGESVERVRDPLSDDADRNFVDLALVALDRANRYMCEADRPIDRL